VDETDARPAAGSGPTHYPTADEFDIERSVTPRPLSWWRPAMGCNWANSRWALLAGKSAPPPTARGFRGVPQGFGSEANHPRRAMGERNFETSSDRLAERTKAPERLSARIEPVGPSDTDVAFDDARALAQLRTGPGPYRPTLLDDHVAIG
jgi:hypothetical protein